MPRMLALWLEFGTRVCEMESKEDKTRGMRRNAVLDISRDKLASLNGAMGQYYWSFVFSLLHT